MTIKKYATDLNKAIGKPYSQQPGRQHGEGAGHISDAGEEKMMERLGNFANKKKLEKEGFDISFKRVSSDRFSKYTTDHLNLTISDPQDRNVHFKVHAHENNSWGDVSYMRSAGEGYMGENAKVSFGKPEEIKQLFDKWKSTVVVRGNRTKEQQKKSILANIQSAYSFFGDEYGEDARMGYLRREVAGTPFESRFNKLSEDYSNGKISIRSLFSNFESYVRNN